MTIWSNPPIRVGKNELHGLLERWLPRLEPGSDAWLVVQRNLGSDSLQRWLEATYPTTTTRAATTRATACSARQQRAHDSPNRFVDGTDATVADLGERRRLSRVVDELGRTAERDVLAVLGREHPHADGAAGTSTLHWFGAPAPAQCRVASAAATAPVPQDSVSPLPRSCTRIRMRPTPSLTSGSQRNDELDVGAVRRLRVEDRDVAEVGGVELVVARPGRPPRAGCPR